MSILVCENISKLNRKRDVIKNFNYNFLENKVYAIVGKSDSGHDTLLNLITGKLKPTYGNVFLDGEILFNNNKVNERLCYISSDTIFPKGLKVEYILNLMNAFYPKWDNAYANKLLAHFNIELKSRFRELSTAKRQILRGILGISSRANITLFDNSMDYVDVKDRYDYFNFLYSHHKIYPRTIIMTTNYIDEIAFIIDQVLFLDNGKLIANFTTNEIQNNFKYLSGKTEVLKSLITGIKIIGVEERDKELTVCIRMKLTKDDIRKYQKYLIKISDVPIEKVFIYLINLREKKGIQ